MALIERFLQWINEDPHSSRAKRVSHAEVPKQIAPPAPKAQLQIIAPQRSLQSPQRLRELVAEHDAKQLQVATAQYESFVTTGYQSFMLWVESLIEKAATFGGRFLLLTFDNSSGIVTATTPPREILSQTSYSLPITQSAVQRLVAATADHFRKAKFRVQMSRQESSFSRLGAQLAPAYDCLDILWAEMHYAAHGGNILNVSLLPTHGDASKKRHVGFAETDIRSIKRLDEILRGYADPADDDMEPSVKRWSRRSE